MGVKYFRISRDAGGTHTITADTPLVPAIGVVDVYIEDTFTEADVRSAIRAFERYARRQGSSTTSPDDWPTSGSTKE